MFSTRKKLERDREAGLWFVWRGVRSNTGAVMVSVAVVGIITAVVASVVRVQVVAPSEVVERHAMVVVVAQGADDGGWAALAEERSPLPSRFDVEGEVGVDEELAAMLDNLEQRRPEYRPQLTEVGDDEGDGELSLAQAGVAMLPPRGAVRVAAGEGGEIEAFVDVQARGDLAGRLAEELPGWTGGVSREWIGRSLSFVVGVDGGGQVRHCMPLDESLEALDVAAEGWLRRLRFAPVGVGGAELAWGTVEFSLQRVVR